MPLLADKTATVTNTHYDGDSDTETPQTTTLSGVSWYGQTITQVGTDGLRAASLYKMRVFAASTAAVTPDGSATSADSSYLLPAEWQALDAAGRKKHWTLQPGDTVTCGGTTATVLAIHDNRGSRQNPHIYVEAK